jgi:hypothetical protein
MVQSDAGCPADPKDFTTDQPVSHMALASNKVGMTGYHTNRTRRCSYTERIEKKILCAIPGGWKMRGWAKCARHRQDNEKRQVVPIPLNRSFRPGDRLTDAPHLPCPV